MLSDAINKVWRRMMKANERQVGGDHYKKSAIQHWDWSAASDHDGFQYSITKYVDRWKRKDGLKDLRKALHHLEKYIEMIMAGEIPSTPRTGILTRKEYLANLPLDFDVGGADSYYVDQ